MERKHQQEQLQQKDFKTKNKSNSYFITYEETNHSNESIKMGSMNGSSSSSSSSSSREKFWKFVSLILFLALCCSLFHPELDDLNFTKVTPHFTRPKKKKSSLSLHGTMEKFVSKRTFNFSTLDETWDWLCPNKVPDMDATAEVFRIAQDIFYNTKNSNLSSSSSSSEIMIKKSMYYYYNRTLTEKYFSHWPGQASYVETKEGGKEEKYATFLRTWKCGSKTMQKYLKQNAKYYNEDGGRFVTSLIWDYFPKDPEPECIISSFREPMSHFISGVGEIEARMAIHRKNNISIPVQRFEAYPIRSEQRFISFVDFLLRYEWDPDGPTSRFRHVFPQSGHLYTLNTINKTITRFISMKNLTEEIQDSLINTCGITEVIDPPAEKGLHAKVDGLDDFLKGLWASTQMGDASSQVATAFETICLLDAIDYACLAPELHDPPPEFCVDVYKRYLYNIYDF